MQAPRSFLSQLILAAFVLAVAGCSMLRLGYANGDSFVYWWLDGYVDFTDEQKPWVSDEIDRFFAWHRRTQLPDYAQVLARARQRLQQPATAAEVKEDFGVMRERAARVLEFALPALTKLALSLSPEQIANIERKFEKNNEKFRNAYLRGGYEDRQQARFDKVMKHAEYWFGSFSREQKARIRAISDARSMDDALWMAERRQRQQALIALLKKIQAERPGHDAAFAMLRAYGRQLLDNRSRAGNHEFFDASRDSMAGMIAQIVNMTTPRQKAHAARRLQTLIEDGYALAGVRMPESLQTEVD